MPGKPNGGTEGGKDPQPSATPADIALHIKAALVKESLENAEFRRLALSDPRAAVRRSRFIAGAEKLLPSGYTFRVVEETPEVLYLVIPHEVAEDALDPGCPKNVLLRKATRDPAFLDRLVTDPRSVIEAEFLVEVPPGFDVRVLRETPLESIAVLPADLRPEDKVAIPNELLEYQASAWGGGDGCNKTFLGSLIENLCKHDPKASDFESPFCTSDAQDCPVVEPM